MNTKQLVASLGVVLSLLSTSVARADESPRPKAAASVKKPAKKRAAAKKKVAVEVAAPAEPTVVPVSLVPDAEPAPKAPEPPKSEPVIQPSAPRDSAQSDRSATREASEKPISIAPLVGFASDGLRFGVGVRAGYTIPVGGSKDVPSGGVYVGGSFMYHVGFSVDAGPYGSTSFSAFYPSGEVGYELRPIDRLSIRPYGGAGVIFANVTAKGMIAGQEQEVSMNSSSLVFYPGCAVSYDVPKTNIFAGGDARLLVPVEGASVSFGVFASGGVRF